MPNVFDNSDPSLLGQIVGCSKGLLAELHHTVEPQFLQFFYHTMIAGRVRNYYLR